MTFIQHQHSLPRFYDLVFINSIFILWLANNQLTSFLWRQSSISIPRYNIIDIKSIWKLNQLLRWAHMLGIFATFCLDFIQKWQRPGPEIANRLFITPTNKTKIFLGLCR